MTDADLAALFAGKRDVAPGLLPVADVLAALSTEPSPGELAGEARALAEFRRQASALVSRRRARRGTARPTSRLSAKVATGAAAVAVLLGGAATAAFANVLPTPIQRFAHAIIGAPGAPPASQRGPARGTAGVPVPLASHGNHAATAKPHSTSRHPNRQADGQPGTGQNQGQQGTGQSQGQQGTGQSQGSGQGGSHAKGQSGNPHDQGQSADGQGQPGSGQGQGKPHAVGQHANPHSPGQQGNPHPSPKPAAHQDGPARQGPAMEP